MKTQIGNELIDTILRFTVPQVQTTEGDLMAKIAASNHPVLVLGESGTGKELVARAIHFNSPRRNRPFFAIDCGALVPSLIEAELFGYVKGAFTGATGTKTGLLALAEDGTIFLDEVGELPIDLQAKLLRALQEGEIRPVGSASLQQIRARIVAATNRDLGQAVKSGAFRKDLYYRLSVLNLRIPPLRERVRDIVQLSDFLLQRLSIDGKVLRLSAEALAMMKLYPWPGNIRELENCLKRATVFAEGPEIMLGDLPAEIRMDLLSQSDLVEGVTFQAGTVVPMPQLEQLAIFHTLRAVNGDIVRAASLLQMGKTTLYRKLKAYGTCTYADAVMSVKVSSQSIGRSKLLRQSS